MKTKVVFLKKTFNICFLLVSFSCIAISCSCNREKKDYDREIKKSKLDSLSDINVKALRYEQDLFSIPIDSLKEVLIKLHSKYSFFYSLEDLENSMNISSMKLYLKDPTIVSLYKECEKQFPDIEWLEKDLAMMFRRIKYAFPEWNVPKVFTYVSGGDFDYPVKYADNNLIIAIDLYLGQKYSIYKMWNIPQYLSFRMSKEHIIVRCALEIARSFLEKQPFEPKTLLDKMLWNGKMLYFTDIVLPDIADSTRIGYNTQQLFWAEKNQGNVWGFFIDKNLLHSNKPKDSERFIAEAPFTSSFSNNSAPRIGSYIGWQIVRFYMANNKEISLKNLIENNNSQEILNKSVYKPEKIG